MIVGRRGKVLDVATVSEEQTGMQTLRSDGGAKSLKPSEGRFKHENKILWDEIWMMSLSGRPL